MNRSPFDAAPPHGRGQSSATGARRSGEYVGTTWRTADPSPTLVRWVLQVLLLVAAFLLLMSFYTVVRGAVARGPAVFAAAPASVAAALPAEREERECDSALRGGCVLPPANTLSVGLIPQSPRLVSFEPR